jgi:DNA mismatch repair protein MutS2
MPLDSQEAIESELGRVDEIRKYGKNTQFFVPFEPGYLKLEVMVVPYLSIEIIVLLKKFLIFTMNLKEFFKKTTIRHFFDNLHSYAELVKEIELIIDEDNQIKDTASRVLQQIRRQKKTLSKKIKQILTALLNKRPSIFTSPNVVERNNRYVLSIKSNFKTDIPGIIHSYSNSGETVFIEPIEITSDSARLSELHNLEAKEIENILSELTMSIRSRIEHIECDIDSVISLDVLFAKVQYANDIEATRPIFGNRFNVVNSYHPILMDILDRVVPLDLQLDPNKKILLISGPNAGGKTVVLKTMGLMVLMAKCGLFIPTDEGSSLPFFDEVYADIGDEQSIESHLSTFAAHLNQIKTALSGKSNSLVLLDELMSQTSVEEGSALATAIIEEFSRRETTVMATTHNENLKIFVTKRDDMTNAGMEFTDRPTYRLIVGIPQASNAIKLAQQLGINGGIIESAYAYLDKEKMSLHEVFEDLSQELKAVQDERQKLSRLINDYESKMKDFSIFKKKELDQLRSKYKDELIHVKRTIERMVKTLKKEGPQPELVHKTRDFLEEKMNIEEPHQPYYPQIGEIVRLRDLKRNGQVIAEHQGKFKISLANMYFWVGPKDIESVRESKRSND